VAPLSSERYEFHFSGSRNAYETLRYIQTLLSHRPAERELPEVFESALELYQRHLEKGKFAATTRPLVLVRDSRLHHATSRPR
jgi:hypothetical protein